MGKVMSSLGARLGRFNIENRTQKFLDKKQIVPAPKYEGNVRDYERVLQEIPDIVEKLNTKDASLDSRLRKVFVTSKDTSNVPDPEKLNLNRPLPMDTKRIQEYEFGHKDPENITPGKATLKQAITFISDYQNEPKKWPIPRICEEYKLKDEDVFNILQYFRAFKLHINDPKQKAKMVADPGRIRSKLLSGK